MSSWQRAVLAATAMVWADRDGELVGGAPLGTAVLIEPGRLLTCRHVVTDDGQQGGQLPVQVWVSFPGGRPVRARPVEDGVPDPGVMDAVGLRLDAGTGSEQASEYGDERPRWPEPVVLSGRARPPSDVELIGYPAADRTLEGVWRSFTVTGPTVSGLVQLGWTEDAGSWPGHSGGPVVDSHTGRLVGLLKEGSEPGRFDRYLPLTLLLRHGVLHRLPWLVEGSQAETHLTARARGLSGSAESEAAIGAGADLFRGRRPAVTRLQEWLTSASPPGRVLVVTGQPGAGKSAVVSRAALNARGRLAARDGQPAGALAGSRWSGLLFHARGARSDTFRAAVADLAGADDSTVGDLMRDVDRLGEADPDQRWVIVVDGLDEAASSEDRQAIAELLTTLAHRPWVRAAVGTRTLSPAGPYAPGSLLTRFGVHGSTASNLMDLDDDAYFDIADLQDLVVDRLCLRGEKYPGPGAWQRYREDKPLRSALADVVADRAARNYLVAVLNASGLGQRDEVIDPRAAGFMPADIPSGVGDALEGFLDRALGHRPGADSHRLRGALVALGYAAGTGITDAIWRLFADALGYPITQADLDELRASAVADYLLQTATERDGTTTRLFHQALTDHLLADRDQRQDQNALMTSLLLQVRGQGGWAGADRYCLAHIADHAQPAGRLPELLTQHDYLIRAEGAGLMAMVGRLPPEQRPPEAAVILRAGPAAYSLPPAQRAGLFAVSAAHLGLAELRQRFISYSSGLPRPLWAHSLGTPHTTLTGHADAVRAVTAVPVADGRTLIASGSFDHTVRLWDPATGQQAGDPLTGHTDGVLAVAAVPVADGRTLIASGSRDHTVRLWDPATGQQIGDPLTGHTDGVLAVAAVPLADGRTLIASGSDDFTVRLWDPATGQQVGDPLTGHTGQVIAVAAARLADGRTLIATSHRDFMLRLWDLATGQQVGDPLTGDLGAVNAVAAVRLADGRTLIASGDGYTVRLWDPATGQQAGGPLNGHTGQVNAVAAVRLADGRTLIASGGDDFTVRLWDLATGQQVGGPLTGHTDVVWTVAAVQMAGGRTLIFSGGRDDTMRLWDPATGPQVGDPLNGHTDKVLSVAAARLADGRTVIASGSYDHTVRLWDPATGQQVGDRVVGRDGAVWVGAAVPLPGEHTVIASSSSFGLAAQLWDLGTGQQVGSALTSRAADVVPAVAAVQLADGRTLIASGHRDFMLRLWDASTGQQVGDPLTGHTGWVYAVAAMRLTDGRTLIASGSGDRTVRLWDPATGHPVGDPLTGHTAAVHAVTAVPLADGRTVIASGSRDRTVRLWDPATGHPVGDPLTGHTAAVWAVTAVPLADGRTVIASGSGDQTVRLWDPVTGHPVVDPLTLLEPVSALAAVDGKVAAAAGRAIVMLAMAPATGASTGVRQSGAGLDTL